MVIEERLTVRLFAEQDLDQVLELWAAHSGWGAITADDFRSWYIHSPNGACIIVLMVDETINKVIGVLTLMPAEIRHGQSVVKGLKLSAPIIDAGYRTYNLKSPEHPINRMWKFVYETAGGMGYKVVYATPAHGWLPVFRQLKQLGLGGWNYTSYSCRSVSLLDPEHLYAEVLEIFSVAPFPAFTEEHYACYRASERAQESDYGIDRNSSWSQYKFRGHLKLEVRDKTTGSMLGYLAVKKQTGLVSELVSVKNADIGLLVKAAAAFFHHAGAGKPLPALTQLKLMFTPVFQQVPESVSWDEVDFTFAFACCPLVKEEAFQGMQCEKWQIMPED